MSFHKIYPLISDINNTTNNNNTNYNNYYDYFNSDLNSDDDTSYEDNIENINPSEVINNDSNNYETDSNSTGYNENTIMATSKRRPSFIRKSLNKFMTSVKNSSDPISSHTLAITNNNHNNKTPLFCGVCSVVSILTFGLLG